ncbi:hypothetical protein ACWCPT_03420 [Streptomyces sp. NPDC002308]
MSKHARPAPEEPGEPSTSAAPATHATSLTATSSDQGRAYQANRDQTINEQHHHHYAPRSSLKTNLTWSLVGVVILALGGIAAIDLWDRHTGTDAATGGDAKTVASLSPSATPTPAPTATASASPSPSAAKAEEAAVAPSVAPTTPSAAVPPPNPLTSCTSWRDTNVGTVQVKPCFRIEGGHLYIGAEWRTTSGSALADVYVWLENDAAEVVYPAASIRYGMSSHRDVAWEVPKDKQQWVQYEVEGQLNHGDTYEVCVRVLEPGTNPSEVAKPDVTGFQIEAKFT